MAQNIPTTQQITDQNLANLEGQLNQNSPLADKAYLRVEAAMEALMFTTLYKLAISQTKQTLAITADESGLTRLGDEFNVPRKAAVSAVLNIDVTSSTGGTLVPTIGWIAASNGLRYFIGSSVVIPASTTQNIEVTCQLAGAAGNLNAADTMTLESQIPGLNSESVVTDTVTTGAEQEDLEVWRSRILFEIRTTTGGSNTTDHKKWAEEVEGVKRAYPYSGNLTIGPATSFPGDRTVFVEADSTIDPDGIPPQSLLDQVRVSLNTDPVTLQARPALGLVDSTLFVEPIIRTSFEVAVSGLQVQDEDQLAGVKDKINTALTNYFASIFPFVEGIDVPAERNDTITDLTVSRVVQDVLSANGGTATGITFNVLGFPVITTYLLAVGELAKFKSPASFT